MRHILGENYAIQIYVVMLRTYVFTELDSLHKCWHKCEGINIKCELYQVASNGSWSLMKVYLKVYSPDFKGGEGFSSFHADKTQ